MPAPFTINKVTIWWISLYSEQKEPDTIVHYIEVWVYFIKQKKGEFITVVCINNVYSRICYYSRVAMGGIDYLRVVKIYIQYT